MRKKSSGSGTVQARSRGGGSVVAAPEDRGPSALQTPRQGILFVEAREAREVDGMVTHGLYGWTAETDSPSKVLFVPSAIADSPASALLLCRERGLVRSKLDALSDEAANYVWLTNIAKRELEN